MNIRKKDFDASDLYLASYYLQKSPDSAESFNFSSGVGELVEICRCAAFQNIPERLFKV